MPPAPTRAPVCLVKIWAPTPFSSYNNDKQFSNMFRKKKETVAADAPSTKHKCVLPGAVNSKLPRSKY